MRRSRNNNSRSHDHKQMRRRSRSHPKKTKTLTSELPEGKLSPEKIIQDTLKCRHLLRAECNPVVVVIFPVSVTCVDAYHKNNYCVPNYKLFASLVEMEYFSVEYSTG